MRMQNNTVACREAAQSLFNFVDRPRQCRGNLMTAWCTTCPPQPIDERMMNFSVKGGGLHRYLLWILTLTVKGTVYVI
jgi:hypothetical protein